MKTLVAVLVSCLLLPAPVFADEPLAVGGSDSIQKVLEKQVGKRVSLRMQSGEELAGTVKSVNGEVVHIGELAGKEFYDAVVALDSVEAVVVRVR